MITLGIVLVVLGALLEASIYLRRAWPTGLTWLMMGAGFLLVAVGLTRRGDPRARVAWLLVLIFVSVVAGLWLTG